MSYNNGSVMTNDSRRRQGPAQRSTGRAGAGTFQGASGETAGGNDEGRSDFMVDDHDPLDARAALRSADAMMIAMKGGAQ